tara:strand:- start:1311 stop:1925 length:615 start_codon:yes stop_codon:yes gene_type:complete
VDTPSEDNSDEELADLMADPDSIVASDFEETNAGVEVGIPPSLGQEDEDTLSQDETFSVNDFEEDFHSKSSSENVSSTHDESSQALDDDVSDPEELDEEIEEEIEFSDDSNGNGDGDVAKFRKTLAGLSRQLELDRLAFLHQSMRDSGEKVPSLSQIASDISGKKLIKPAGDCDIYSKRPTARLDGWISGLSFGVSKRAKKFSK